MEARYPILLQVVGLSPPKLAQYFFIGNTKVIVFYIFSFVCSSESPLLC